MTVCAVKLCHNRSERENKKHNITFHRLPVDPVIAEEWIKNIRLSRGQVYWKPTKGTRICSKHFNSEDKYFTATGKCKLRREAVPVKDLNILCTDTNAVELNVGEVSPVVERADVTENVPETKNKETQSSPQPSTSRGMLRRPSDEEFHYIFDTPHMARLRKKLDKTTLLNIKYKKIIKSLKQKNRRLQNKNESLKGILGELKKKRFINIELSNLLSENVFEADQSM